MPNVPALSEFEREVARVVKAIPRGCVSSYGQVAARAGLPGRARAVARALGRVGPVPWWRVIRSDGTVAPEVAAEQARRLRAEGVPVKGRRVDGAVALNGAEGRVKPEAPSRKRSSSQPKSQPRKRKGP